MLVPGSGLGRLAFDIAHDGFSAQGNEFSYYMLLASNFILNKTQRINQFKIYPYIHSFSNIVKSGDVLTEATIPDVNPSEIPRGTDFSMVAGDFIEVYGMEEENYGKIMKKRSGLILVFYITDKGDNEPEILGWLKQKSKWDDVLIF